MRAGVPHQELFNTIIRNFCRSFLLVSFLYFLQEANECLSPHLNVVVRSMPLAGIYTPVHHGIFQTLHVTPLNSDLFLRWILYPPTQHVCALLAALRLSLSLRQLQVHKIKDSFPWLICFEIIYLEMYSISHILQTVREMENASLPSEADSLIH